MATTATETLAELYLSDETAWLEEMAELIKRKEFSQLDYDNLKEYLTDMARRDKRELLSRLIVLISHHLKWDSQKSKRSQSWRATIIEQRRELEQIFELTSLHNYAESNLGRAYQKAVEEASEETGLPISSFPAKSAHTAAGWASKPVPRD